MVRAISENRTVVAEVTGTDRYKYFRRPVTETKDGSPGVVTTRFPLLGLENVTSLGLLAPPTTAQKPPTRYEATQMRATQTDYRESEAQTVPWTPPFTTRGNSTPEVLYLDQLSWGKGLPPGRHEVGIVERLRRKRAWEARLPPMDCEENINLRYKLIAEMEKSDWQFREKEIEAIHEVRMKKSEQLLEQHNLLNRTRLNYRMEFLEDDINKRKEKKLQFIRHDKERALRKLCMREKGYNPKKYKMNILDEHLRHTSELYAPMKRFGVSFKNKNEILTQKQFNIDVTDICDFEYALDYKPVFDFNKAAQPKKQTELCIRETRWTMANLVKLHEDLQKLRAKESKKGAPFYGQIDQQQKPSSRPEIPQLSCSQVPLCEESLYQAAVMLQRVIHSRSMQALMEQKRQCWKELMEELKTSRNGVEKHLLLNKNKDRMIMKARLAGVLDNIIGMNVGTSIGQTLYLLATELLRFKNEGIAHDQAIQAEGARWRRELPEEGRRQKEIRRREEHNLMFAQLLEVYQDSINEFLKGIVNQALQNEAKLKAYEHAQEVARLAELEQLKSVEPEEEEPISADLLFEFIAPEGLRELTRTCMLILKQKYMEARQCLVELGQAESLSEKISDKLTDESNSVDAGQSTLVKLHSQEQIGSTNSEFICVTEPSAFVASTLSVESPTLTVSATSPPPWPYCEPDPSAIVPSSPSTVSSPSLSTILSASVSDDSTPTLSTILESPTLTVSATSPLPWPYCEPDPSAIVPSSPSTVSAPSLGASISTTLTAVEPDSRFSSVPSISTGLKFPALIGDAQSYIYSEVSDMVSALMSSASNGAQQCRRFGLQSAPEPPTPEERLLARITRDMCYVAGSLLHTAAKVLNKALILAGIPQESFEEALRRTTQVIQSALEEVICLILPKKPQEKQPISEELIAEASKIVDEILKKAKERIAAMKDEDRFKTVFDTECQAKALVEDVIKEAQQKVLRMIVEDFLSDLIEEATNKTSVHN